MAANRNNGLELLKDGQFQNAIATGLEWHFNNSNWRATACVTDADGIDVLADFELLVSVNARGLFVGWMGRNKIECDTFAEAKCCVESLYSEWLAKAMESTVAA